MASARKKQDEKNLKFLRELVSLPGNKHCFDCNQRGPTYVNMTIGSFVCTKCSGMLRGLTPPHRVKSISMASFTNEEVDFVKSRGNDHCRQTWLALYDQNSNTETKDEQDIKDFMMDKYERKRYYHQKGLQNGTLSSPPRALPTPNGGTVPLPPSQKSQEPEAFVNCVWNEKNGFTVKNNEEMSKNGMNNDFVADFNSANIFSTEQFNNNVENKQPSFANFDNNVIFNSATSSYSYPSFTNTQNYSNTQNYPIAQNYPSVLQQNFPSSQNLFVNQMTHQYPQYVTSRWNVTSPPTLNGSSGIHSTSPMTKPVAPPSEDRYAALKDLDNALKSQQMHMDQHIEWSTASSNGSGYTSPLFGSPSTTGGSMYGSPSQGNFAAAFQHQEQPSNISNPFTLSASPRNPWSSPNNTNYNLPTSANNTVIANNCFPTYNNGMNGVSSGGANPFRSPDNVTGFNGIGKFNSVQNGFNGQNGMHNGFNTNGNNGFQQNMFSNGGSSHFGNKWNTPNPFTLGVSPSAGGNSNNPFL